MNLVYREVLKSDLYDINYLLQSISKFNPSIIDITANWSYYIEQKNLYALVGVLGNDIITFGSIFLEKKIRGGIFGHIEDIVVRNDFQGNGIGKELINKLILYAKDNNCYKVTLTCNKSNIGFYEKIGFTNEQVSMKFII